MPLDKVVGQQIADDIQARRIAAIDRSGGTYEKIAKELCSIAFAHIDDFVTVFEGGEIQAKPFTTIPKKKLAAVKKIKEHTRITESADGEKMYKDSTIEYELHDKLKALWNLVELRGDKPSEKHEHELKGSITVETGIRRPGDGED